MKAVIEMVSIGDKGMFYIPFVVYLYLSFLKKGDASAKYK